MKNTIVVKGKGIKSEFLCKEDIYPGMLCELVVDNGVIKIQKNTNANNLKETCFVTEYEAFGKTVLDKAATGDTAHVYFANAGDIIYTRVDSGVAVGDKLVSNGSGLLKKVNAANATGTSTDITTAAIYQGVASGLTISGTSTAIPTEATYADVASGLTISGTSTDITTEVIYAGVASGLTISGYGVTAIALDNAEEVESGIYFARVIIL
ncbi:MAG: hypothetical protein KA799_03925 [Bacteroidales bacterium]|nr:hypothetical protein [Bacteroidales bacterium]